MIRNLFCTIRPLVWITGEIKHTFDFNFIIGIDFICTKKKCQSTLISASSDGFSQQYLHKVGLIISKIAIFKKVVAENFFEKLFETRV